MGVRRLGLRGLGVAAAAVLWTLGAVPVAAAETPDPGAGQPFYSGSYNLHSAMAQTFTPGAGESIDRVDLMLGTFSGASSITVQLTGTTGGKPNAALVATTTTTDTVVCCHRTKEVDFPHAAAVFAAQKYAIVVRPVGNLTFYANFGNDDYTGGQAWLASGPSRGGGARPAHALVFPGYTTPRAAP